MSFYSGCRTALVIGVGALAAASGQASATGFGKCSAAPKDKWKPIGEAEIAARAAGYQVRRAKIDGTCYEVYGSKDGSLFELYYDPATMKHVHTIKLR